MREQVPDRRARRPGGLVEVDRAPSSTAVRTARAVASFVTDAQRKTPLRVAVLADHAICVRQGHGSVRALPMHRWQRGPPRAGSSQRPDAKRLSRDRRGTRIDLGHAVLLTQAQFDPIPSRGPAWSSRADHGARHAYRPRYSDRGPIPRRLRDRRVRTRLLLGRGEDVLAAARRVDDRGWLPGRLHPEPDLP